MRLPGLLSYTRQHLDGKYPARLHLTIGFVGASSGRPRAYSRPPCHQELPLDEVTLAQVLKPLGYVSASIGKWHLGGASFYPDEHGLDLNAGGTYRGHPESYFGSFRFAESERLHRGRVPD